MGAKLSVYSNFTGFVIDGEYKVCSAIGAVLATEIETGVAPSSSMCSSFFFVSTKRPISHSTQIPANPVQISGFCTCSSCHSYSHPLNSGHGAEFKNLGRSEMRFGQLGFDHFLVSSVSDGGSDGYGASGGRGEVYLFVETKKKDEHIEEEGATPVSIFVAKTAPIAEQTLYSPSITKPVKLL
nr:hypothetical protein CFP56_42867 [Quercus suber]